MTSTMREGSSRSLGARRCRRALVALAIGACFGVGCGATCPQEVSDARAARAVAEPHASPESVVIALRLAAERASLTTTLSLIHPRLREDLRRAVAQASWPRLRAHVFTRASDIERARAAGRLSFRALAPTVGRWRQLGDAAMQADYACGRTWAHPCSVAVVRTEGRWYLVDLD